MQRKVLSIAASLVLGMVAALALWPGMSCAAPAQKELAPVPNAEQLQAHLRQVQQWAASLKGLKVEQARKLFGQMRPKESTWKFEGKDQPVLTYEFPGYDIELYCLPERVIMVSIDLVVE
jgi:hypothetical protein